MLDDILNILDGKGNLINSEFSKEIKGFINKKSEELAEKRNQEVTNEIIDEITRGLIKTGDLLKTFKEPGDWKLNTIVDNDFCAQCGSCEVVCPNDLIAFDEKPYLEYECKRKGHGMCHEICPRVDSGAYQISIREDLYEEFYFGKSNIPGQDGGVITSFLKYLLDEGKIDGAIVVGDKKWKPVSLIVKDSEALKDTTKSKYSISSLAAFKQAAEMGIEKVAIVGLPCQIQGLRKLQYFPYLAKHGHELGDKGKPVNFPKIEYLIGLFCTEKFNFETIEKVLSENKILIQDVKKFDVSNGKFIIETEEDTVKVPVKDMEMASGCKFCRDFDSHLADVSVGSVGSEDGNSTIIIRSDKGKEIENVVDLKEGVNVSEIDKLKTFKLNRFKKAINENIKNEKFVSYYWNSDYAGAALRSDGNYFIRIRASVGGWYDYDEIKFINEIAKKYQARVKLTNRGAYELHDIKPIDVEEVVKELAEKDLITGSEGPLVRATLACPGAFNCALGLINTQEVSYALEEKFSEFPTNYKFKIAVNGCPNKCSRPQIHDFGIAGEKYPYTVEENCNGCGRCADVCKVDALHIRGEMCYTDYNICIGCGKCIKACPNEAKEVKEEGYAIYVGGKAGREVIEAIELKAKTIDEIVDLIERVITVYNKLAIKPQKERLAATMKRIGRVKFMEEVNKLKT